MKIPTMAPPDSGEPRSEFLGVLVLGLSGPIASIRHGLDRLASGPIPAGESLETVSAMRRQLDLLAQQVDELIGAVRTVPVATELVGLQVVILRDVLNAALESIEPAMLAKHQQVVVTEAHLDISLNVDPSRLAQVFANIISNCVKNTPAGGQIGVAVTVADELVSISIDDERLRPSELSGLFEPPANPTVAAVVDSSTVGLGLVRGMLALNAGTVQTEVKPGGRGAVVTVRLPTTPLTPSAPHVGDELIEPGHWRSHRILIVDDNQDAANTLGMLLELEGQTVRIAHDGPGAVAEAGEFLPEAIVMDVGLPGFSGLKAVEMIRADHTGARPFVVALTGRTSAADRAATRAAGFDLHLAKPLRYAQLKTALAAAFQSDN